jgi:hypothetical protein
MSIASTHLGSTLIPSFDTICPKILPYSIVKCDFFGLRDKPNFLHFSKVCLRCNKCFASELEKTCQII